VCRIDNLVAERALLLGVHERLTRLLPLGGSDLNQPRATNNPSLECQYTALSLICSLGALKPLHDAWAPTASTTAGAVVVGEPFDRYVVVRL
jgi:hypothetical protein